MHGEPLIYGRDRDKGLKLDPQTLTLEAVTIGQDGVSEGDLAVHDETNPVLAQMPIILAPPLPTAMGVIHRHQARAFDANFAIGKPRERRVLVLLHRWNVLDRR